MLNGDANIQPVGEIGGVKMYSFNDITRALGLKTRTLEGYARNGKIKGVKIGGQWFISESNLQDFLNGKTGE